MIFLVFHRTGSFYSGPQCACAGMTIGFNCDTRHSGIRTAFRITGWPRTRAVLPEVS